MRYREDLPYRTTVEDTWIPLPDGTRLYARIWRPVTDAPVPALLEYLPYRLSDWTAPRDAQRHPWYAGHGYASVRVDIRGHGNSEGLPGDEYDATELADGVAVVEWLAAQPWCTGRVGMFGISWGGFNALQVAALAPPALRAVVTVCSTDDRYDNDVHYMGGSVLAVDMHAWSATMLAFASRPPDPAFVGEERWLPMWRERLEHLEPLIHTWLAHQRRDAYWRHGSVCEDYSAIKAPVLAVGGWADPYRDTVLRLVEHLPADRVRGIIGPWSHQYPDRGLPPGPAIGFLQETLRWWDHWLRDADDGADEGTDKSTDGSANRSTDEGTGKATDGGVLDEPLLRAWINESAPPATTYPVRAGRWVGAGEWPSRDVEMTTYRLSGTMRSTAGVLGESGPVEVVSPQQTGVDAGRFFPFGNDADLPPDQREEDGRSVCFDTGSLGHRVEILGRAVVRLRVTVPTRRGQVIARLCDVAPDGSSTLVTRGVLNLLSREGRDRTVEWAPGATEDVTFELWGVGHAFPPGHRIRLALSSAYWPWIWPHPDAHGFTVDPEASAVELPVRTAKGDRDRAPIRFEEPEQAPPLGVVFGDASGTPERGTAGPTTAEPGPEGIGRPERLVRRDVARGLWMLDVDPRCGGSRTCPDGLVFREDARERYSIQERDPLSARTESRWTVGLSREALGWDVEIRTHSEIRTEVTQDGPEGAPGAVDYVTQNRVTAVTGGEVVFDRTWRKSIPREHG